MRVEALLQSSAPPQPPAALASGAKETGGRFDETLTASLGGTQEENGQSATSVQHTVQSGETLSHIVRDYLVDGGESFRTSDIYSGVQVVAQSNDMANPDLIRPGQRIDLSALDDRIPALADDAPASSEPETASAPARVEDSPAQQELATDSASVEPDSFKELVATVPPETAPTISSGDDADEPRSVASHDSSRLTQRDAALPDNVRDQIGDLARNLKEVFGRGTEPGIDVGGKDSPWTAILEQPGRMTSEFGMRESPITGRWQYHRGVDLAAASGTEIYPLKAGHVRFSGWKPGYGNVVIVEHDNRVETLYGHNSENFVEVGDEVSENTAIGAVGSTGHATGPHVHFEVRDRGRAIDPVPFVQELMGTAPETHAQR